MLRFPELESLGLTLAAMTEASDGDFARPGGRPESDAFQLAGFPRREVVTLKQVHGTQVECVSLAGAPCGDEGDALATADSGIAVGVRVADCVPVYLYDPGTRCICIVHAGRQGTYDGVAKAAIGTMIERFGVVPSSIHALIGPSAGPCCYEVSETLAEEFRGRGYPVAGRRLDLWNANVQQLEAAGVTTAKITVNGICTICSGRFHSYRASGTKSRNLAILAL